MEARVVGAEARAEIAEEKVMIKQRGGKNDSSWYRPCASTGVGGREHNENERRKRWQ